MELMAVIVGILAIGHQATALSCFITLGLIAPRKIIELPITSRSEAISNLVGVIPTSDGFRKLTGQEAERLAALARSGRLSDQAVAKMFLGEYRERNEENKVPVIEFIEDIRF